MVEKIFIAGATARSAAQSARQAGLEVAAADLFGDRDLAATGPTYRINRYPDDIPGIARQVSCRHWIYTGGLENAPAVVDSVSQHHRLLGNGVEVLRTVRNPWSVREAVRDAGLHYPEIRATAPSESTVAWLRKPRNSCGGMHICRWPAAAAQLADGMPSGAGAGGTDSHYFQQEIHGRAYGALYIAGTNGARLIGVTRQISGRPWVPAGKFLHVGCVGPVGLDAKLNDQFRRLGECLTASFRLRGLFGVDAIVEGDRVWTVEVNPRFTASVEVHERATNWCALRSHCLACTGHDLPALPLTANGVHGKAVVYATRAAVVSHAFADWLDAQNADAIYPPFVDLPHVGTEIAIGHPILTVMDQASRVSDVSYRLRAKAHTVRSLLDTPSRQIRSTKSEIRNKFE